MGARGPKPESREMLLRTVAALRRKRKTKHRLPSIRVWPNQVAAGITSLQKYLITDPENESRGRIYRCDQDKLVRAIFRAMVLARYSRQTKPSPAP